MRMMEFDRIRAMLADCAWTEGAKAMAHRLVPDDDIDRPCPGVADRPIGENGLFIRIGPGIIDNDVKVIIAVLIWNAIGIRPEKIYLQRG